MGRAIDQDNRLDDLERRLKLAEDALEQMIQTKMYNVDLTEEVRDDLETRTKFAEHGIDGVTVEPDKKTKKKRTKKLAKAT